MILLASFLQTLPMYSRLHRKPQVYEWNGVVLRALDTKSTRDVKTGRFAKL